MESLYVLRRFRLMQYRTLRLTLLNRQQTSMETIPCSSVCRKWWPQRHVSEAKSIIVAPWRRSTRIATRENSRARVPAVGYVNKKILLYQITVFLLHSSTNVGRDIPKETTEYYRTAQMEHYFAADNVIRSACQREGWRLRSRSWGVSSPPKTFPKLPNPWRWCRQRSFEVIKQDLLKHSLSTWVTSSTLSKSKLYLYT